MGLDSFLLKVPKKELEGVAELRRVPLHKATQVSRNRVWRGHKHELAYWRGHRDLNRWMGELYRQKYLEHPEHVGCLSIILDEADILSLKLEMTFGSLAPASTKEILWTYDPAVDLMVPPDDTPTLDRALRIIRNNRSYVYYNSSW
jgi:hypothetical protein